MFVHEFNNPIPVVTPIGNGMAIYVTVGGTFEDDCWCVALSDGGQVRHFVSAQIKLWHNETYGLNKKNV